MSSFTELMMKLNLLYFLCSGNRSHFPTTLFISGWLSLFKHVATNLHVYKPRNVRKSITKIFLYLSAPLNLLNIVRKKQAVPNSTWNLLLLLIPPACMFWYKISTIYNLLQAVWKCRGIFM